MPYPYGETKGENYLNDNRATSPFFDPPCPEVVIPDEGRTRIVCGVILTDDSDSPYGQRLRPQSLRATSQYLVQFPSAPIDELNVQPYRGLGDWWLDHPAQDFFAHGGILRPRLNIGCLMEDRPPDLIEPPGIIADDFGPEHGLVDSDRRFSETSRLLAFLKPDNGSPRGGVLRFRGPGGCPNIARLVGTNPFDDSFGEFFWRYLFVPADIRTEQDPGSVPFDAAEGLYHYDVFGVRCVSCPILFVTFTVPCLGCSWRPEDVNFGFLNEPPLNRCHTRFNSVITDWCDDAGHVALDVGEPHCVSPDPPFDPNWGYDCELVGFPGTPTNHHCEKCVYERCLGFLIGKVLTGSDCLSKLPMRPIRTRDANRKSCNYGCGEFGWTLWSKGAGLTIPWEDWLSDPGRLQISEAPCVDPLNGCFDVQGQEWTSGTRFCGTGFACDCTGGGHVFCTSTHVFRWHKIGTNLITEAHVCFRQWENCFISNLGIPCSSNPIQTVGGYHNPSSPVMVWVDCKIVIKLEFHHWGPNEFDGGTDGCGCCPLLLEKSNLIFDTINVTLIGEFCGPVPWGDGSEWIGYDADDIAREGRYPGRFPDHENAEGADDRGSCGSMFVDQGEYGDFLAAQPIDSDGTPLFDGLGEPPKRCPSYLAGPKFWCPPGLQWRWTWTGGGGNWVPINPGANQADRPNQRVRGNQCWSLQLAKNSGDGCAAGRRHTQPPLGNSVSGCHDPNCRRGCSMRETKDEAGLRLSPWLFPPGRFTPWGCQQCVDIYPQDPRDPFQ